MQAEKIVVLGTGGTIAGRSPDALDVTGYTAGQVPVADLLASLGTERPAWLVVTEQVAQLDSKDMDWPTWRLLAQRAQHWLAQPDVKGLVITHGTDTLEETALFLQRVLRPVKPVVLTCAMRPASALSADGPMNLLDALQVAAAECSGVLVVCAGVIHDAERVQKVHSWRLDAFSSGDAGPRGQIRQGRICWWKPLPGIQPADGQSAVERLATMDAPPRVELLFSHALADGALVRALIDTDATARLGLPPLRGLVVAATGNGSLHRALIHALVQAQHQGVRVWRTSRCPDGGIMDVDDGRFSASALSPSKARVALMLELALQP